MNAYEERNSDFLLENGAAIKANHLLTLPAKVTDLLRDPAHLAAMRTRARQLGRPRAAFTVAERCLALLRATAGRARRSAAAARAGRFGAHP